MTRFTDTSDVGRANRLAARDGVLVTPETALVTLAALEATLALYRDPARAMREVPVLAMLSRSASQLRERANRIRVQLNAKVSVVESEASVGGGAFPNARIPSIARPMSMPRSSRRSRCCAANAR